MKENFLYHQDQIVRLVELILKNYDETQKAFENRQRKSNLANKLRNQVLGESIFKEYSLFEGLNILEENKKLQAKSAEQVLSEIKEIRGENE